MSIAWENTPQTQAFSADSIINNKIIAAAAGLQPSIQRYFLEFATEMDKELVADFILSCVKQENVAIKTKRVYLIALTYLSRSLDNKKSFDVMTADDLSNYLNSMQKPIEEDPDQSWIGTQRMFGLSIQKFFKWPAYPGKPAHERKRLPKDLQPPVLQGFVLQRKKGSKSPIKAKDISGLDYEKAYSLLVDNWLERCDELRQITPSWEYFEDKIDYYLNVAEEKEMRPSGIDGLREHCPDICDLIDSIIMQQQEEEQQ